jgi:uncharacterized protein (DUF488 family)
MLFTIGYSAMNPKQLRRVLDRLKCSTLIDVRSAPRKTRRAGYSRPELESLFGKRYLFAGDELGGQINIQESSLAWLAKRASRRHVAIMCMEERPGNCHRHVAIALPLLDRHRVEVRHVCGDEVIKASELERAIQDDDDYEIERKVFR